jgi:hypothetical protein
MLPGDRRCPGTTPGRSQVAVRKECTMHVSVTGSVIIHELPDAGHQVPRIALPGETAEIAADPA